MSPWYPRTLVLLALGALLLSDAARAQAPSLAMPYVSPHAHVSQTVGVTEVAIDYHRPAVKGRTIFGGLVPYGQVWRAGANDNTTITFSSPVSVGGQQLEAGTYGLHMIPEQNQWTLIFNNVSTAWGSFAYDAAHDAARITVTPERADFTEHLAYRFDKIMEDGLEAALYWENVRVPFRIDIDVQKHVLANLREQLYGLPRFGWQGWNQAAAYALQNGGDLNEALGWVERSLGFGENFNNLKTKSDILEALGRAQEAQPLREKAMAIATENELNNYGYQLLFAGKTDEAIEIFKQNVETYPDSWNVYDSLAEAYATKGQKQLAIEYYERAHRMVQIPAQKQRIEGALANLR